MELLLADLLMYSITGACVGLLVGITGVGGGSLMTPLLLAFGFPAHIAVGTDLLYAAATKAGGVYGHSRQKSVDWSLALLLAAGSLPAAGVTILLLTWFFDDPAQYSALLTTTLGGMLILTSGVILFRRRLRGLSGAGQGIIHQHVKTITLATGIVLGVLVTLSSVGAAAIATAVLMLLYPKMRGLDIVGTNLAHAVPLTLLAGLGHLYLGNVDLVLLGCLLLGSLPAIVLGTRLASRIPEALMQPVLASTLLGLGIKFAFF